MHPRTLRFLLLAVLAAGCSSPGDDDGDITTELDLTGAGFSDTGEGGCSRGAFLKNG